MENGGQFDGQMLLRLRKAAHLTQEELAEAIGAKAAVVANWERGRNAPTPKHWRAVAEYFGLTPADLLQPPPTGGLALGPTMTAPPLDITADPRYSPSQGFVLLPLLGRVTAGPGGIAEENVLSLHHVETTFIPHGQEHDCFLLDVRGESMIDAGLRPGDRLLVCSAVQVNDGDIAVVDVDGEAMVKRVYRRDHAVLLVSDNPAFAPREVETARIIGRVMNATRVF